MGIWRFGFCFGWYLEIGPLSIITDTQCIIWINARNCQLLDFLSISRSNLDCTLQCIDQFVLIPQIFENKKITGKWNFSLNWRNTPLKYGKTRSPFFFLSLYTAYVFVDFVWCVVLHTRKTDQRGYSLRLKNNLIIRDCNRIGTSSFLFHLRMAVSSALCSSCPV